MYKTDNMHLSFKDKWLVYKAVRKGNTNIFAPSLLNSFEKKLSNKINVKYACVLPNCTSSIFVAINALKLKENDEIILPNLTHSSSLYPLLLNNIKFKTYDFIEESYDADVNHIESLIDKNTKAIMVCYLHGYAINIEKIKKICKKHNLYLIEDAAQGFGIKINGKYVGTFGDFGCFSFGESKLLRVGEGGAIVCNNKILDNEVNKIRHVGEIWKCNGKNTVNYLPTYYDLIEEGLDYDGRAFNLRVVPFTFAYAENHLKGIDKLIKSRQNKLKIYYNKINNIDGIKFIKNIEYGINSTAPFSAWLVLDKKYDVNKIIAACFNEHIPIGKFKYPVVSDMRYFKDICLNSKYNYKNSKNIKEQSIFLPLYENLSVKDIKSISNKFIDIINKYNLNSNDEIFNLDILKTNIKYFNGFFIK